MLIRNLWRLRLSWSARQYLLSDPRTRRVDAIGGSAVSVSDKASFTEAMAKSKGSPAASLPGSGVSFVCGGGIGCSCCCADREQGQIKKPRPMPAGPGEKVAS
jgi:hypothetical protein